MQNLYRRCVAYNSCEKKVRPGILFRGRSNIPGHAVKQNASSPGASPGTYNFLVISEAPCFNLEFDEHDGSYSSLRELELCSCEEIRSSNAEVRGEGKASNAAPPSRETEDDDQKYRRRYEAKAIRKIKKVHKMRRGKQYRRVQ